MSVLTRLRSGSLLLGVLLSCARMAFAAPLVMDASPSSTRPAFVPAQGAKPVTLNPAALADLVPGGVSTVQTEAGAVVTVRWLHSFDHASGNVTWVGDVAPYGGLNRALVTFFPGGMTGTLRVASNDGASQLELATYGTTTWLIDSAASGVTLLGPGDQADAMANMANMPATAPAKAKSGVAATGTLSTALPATDAMKNFPRSPVAKAGTAVSQVDVLIMATTELNAFYGGDTQTKAVMDRLIAFSNQVFMDSGVTNLRLNLINNGTLAGTQGMKIRQILDGFNPALPEYIKTSNIAELREQVGADLVAILVTQDSTLNGGHCGSANLPMLQRDLATQSSEMMSVTASGPAFRGEEFRCGEDAVFVHELGHNFGLMHDRTTLVTQGIPLAQQNLAGGMVGSTPYGFGYGIAGKFCDIMSYSQNFSLSGPGSLTASGFNLLRPIFSNPLMGLDASVGGDRAGISEDDTVNSAFGALALFVTAPKVAAYRTPPTARALPLEASPKVFPIQNGYWWSPKESGRGFFVEQRGTTMVFSGYLYATDGKATWFTTVGTVSNNVLNAPMQVYANGQSLTGAYKAPVLVESPGNVTLTFDEPDSATLQWPGGTVELERLNYEDEVDNTTETTAPFEALADSGYWLSTAESGRGYVIEVQGDTLVIGGFMYDTIGNPVWYISNGKLSNFKQYKGTWQAFTGGQSLSGAYKPPVAAPGGAGTLAIDFTSSTDGTLTLPDGRKISITRFVF